MKTIKRIFLSVFFALCMALSLQAGNVNVNFFNGSRKIFTTQVEEGYTYTLSTLLDAAMPKIDMADSICRDYEFVGWKVGSPVEGTETPVTADELAARARFEAVSKAVALRRKDLMQISNDQAAFVAQRDTAGGKKTMTAYLWKVCGQAYDQAHGN